MVNFNNIINYFKNFNSETVFNIIIAFCIIIIFNIVGTFISKIITKCFRKDIKKSNIKRSGLYKALKRFISFIGIYIAIAFLKEPLMIDEKIFVFLSKIFKVIGIFMVAKIITESISLEGLKKLNNSKEDEGMSTFIIKIINVIIYIIAAFIAILELGYDLSGLVTGLGIGSVVITLAAQNIAKDILGGIVIFTDKPFKVGDWIQFENYEGTVEDITFRSTRIRTFENSIVNIPNATISNSSIINCSRIEKRRYKINLTLEIDTKLSTVKLVEEKIKAMLKEKENVMDDSVIVKFDKITDNGINLLIYAFTDSVDYESFLKEKEDINYKIMQILENEKVELAYDTKTIHLKNN